MQEKRSPTFAFTTEKALEIYFSGILAKKTIRNVIKEMKLRFVVRGNESKAVLKLQMLKKCEAKLVRIIRAEEKTVE